MGNSLHLGLVKVCRARPTPARLLRHERPRVKLNRVAVGRPLFAYPFIEVGVGLKLDPMASGPEDDPRPFGVVFGHAKSVGAHERMFAHLAARLPLELPSEDLG
jgi:hypothetical protein